MPTVGPLLLRSLIAQDMFLAGTIVLLLGVLTVIGTFISDLVLMWIDPRIRYQLDCTDEHGARARRSVTTAADDAAAAEETGRGRDPAAADLVALPQAQLALRQRRRR